MKKIYILLLTLCILNFLDYYTTLQCVANGAQEVNPLASEFISHSALPYLKIAGLFFLSTYLIIRAKHDSKSQPRITSVLFWANVAYFLIVISNSVVWMVQSRQ